MCTSSELRSDAPSGQPAAVSASRLTTAPGSMSNAVASRASSGGRATQLDPTRRTPSSSSAGGGGATGRPSAPSARSRTDCVLASISREPEFAKTQSSRGSAHTGGLEDGSTRRRRGCPASRRAARRVRSFGHLSNSTSIPITVEGSGFVTVSSLYRAWELNARVGRSVSASACEQTNPADLTRVSTALALYRRTTVGGSHGTDGQAS